MSGWILLHRQFFDHPFWEEKREFSKAEAWIDLIEQARWKDKETSILHNGKMVKWGRGQLVASVRFLRDRWKWRSNNKVTRFLDLLEKEDMIRYEKNIAIGRVTICKYDDYQFREDTDGTGVRKKNTKNGTRNETQTGRVSDYSSEDYPRTRDAERDADGTSTGQAEDKTVIKGNKGNKREEPPIVPQHPKIEKLKSAGYEELFKMEKPLTGEQLDKLTKEFNPNTVRDVFDAMENFKGLTKKYKSTYLTARQWLIRRTEDDGSVTHKYQTKIHDAGTF